MMTPRERFKVYDEIVHEDPLGHKRLLLECLNSAVEAVQPHNLMKSRLSIDSKYNLSIRGTDLVYSLSSFDKLIVVGAGKAGGSMAEALEAIVPAIFPFSGVVIVPRGASRRFRTNRIRLIEGTHPIPSKMNVKAAAEVVSAAKSATADSLLVCLISGGGSSLMSLPAEGITFQDIVRTTNLLLKCGAGIEKINSVRKHISSAQGGQLARSANGAQVLSLIISDIVGNPISSIASGPTAPDPTTFADALKILKDYNLSQRAPKRVVLRLKKGVSGRVPDTPKPDDRIFEKVTNCIIGDNSTACESVLSILKNNGKFRPFYLGSSWQGEARDAASNLSGIFMTAFKQQTKLSGFEGSTAFVWGGETTVTIRGKGRGGRNQEEALSCLLKLRNLQGITAAFMGTDGIDGFSNAAGAIIDSDCYRDATERKIDAEKYLNNNDSNGFFQKVGGSLLITGLTGTNVNDIGIAFIEPSTPLGTQI